MAGARTLRWAERLFRDLPFDAVTSGYRVVVASPDRCRHPLGFADIWRPPSGPPPEAGDASDELAEAQLLFCVDVCDDLQYELLRKLAAEFCGRLEQPQAMVLLPRAVPPMAKASVRQLHKRRIVALLTDGFDEVVAHYRTAFDVALQLHACDLVARVRLQGALDTFQRRRKLSTKQEQAQSTVEYTMWHYLPPKVTQVIPEVNEVLHEEPLRGSVGGHVFVRRLGAGFFGKVYGSVPEHLYEGTQHVLHQVQPVDAIKIVDKTHLFGLRDLRMLHHMITVHNLVGSARLRHPNIVVMHEVMHSPTHLFFRMEYAGSENLYARLSASSPTPDDELSRAARWSGESLGEAGGKDAAKRPAWLPLVVRDLRDPLGPHSRQRLPSGTRLVQHRPIGTLALQSILEQTSAAVGHLHMHVGACHRDIKLENFVVSSEAAGQRDFPRIKLVDFDFARVVAEPRGGAAAPNPGDLLALDPAALGEPGFPTSRQPCRGKCGTVPYVAPEVMLGRVYDGFAADVWSLGILYLEVFCGVRIMEVTFNIDYGVNFSRGKQVADVAQRSREAFSKPSFLRDLLRSKVRPEAKPLLTGEGRCGGSMEELLQGMICVEPAGRVESSQVLAVLADLPSAAAEAC